MRPPQLLPACFLLALLLQGGCSEDAERFVGNSRLIRGGTGLGTTTIGSPVPDRDTYLPPGTANFGGTLLIGRGSGFEARTFLKFASFNLPDTNLAGFTPGTVLFELAQSQLRRTPTSVQIDLGITDGPLADSASVAWPGPGLGTPLGSVDFGFTGPLVIGLGPGGFQQFKGWALDPSSVPGFILRSPVLDGIAGFRAGLGRFRVPYSWNDGGTTRFDTTNTFASIDYYVHPPLSPSPTGADTTLELGGGFETAIAVRAEVPALTAGYSVNDLRLVFSVIDSLPGVDGSILNPATDSSQVSVTIDVYQITADWSEAETDERAIQRTLLQIATTRFVTAQPGDSLSISLPSSLARTWGLNPAGNHGVLVHIRDANRNPGLVVGSRESSRPPQLRIATTSPPPGRF